MASSSSMLSKLLSPGFTTGDPFVIAAEARVKEVNEAKNAKTAADMATMRAMVKTTVKELEMTEEELYEDLSAVDTSMEKLAKKISNHYNKTVTTYSLGQPTTLTVKTTGGKFSKRPQIGGESFRPIGCYVGKRNKLIHIFKPTAAADYATAELGQDEAKSLFGASFAKHLSNADGGQFERSMVDAAKEERNAAEKVKNAKLEGQYEAIGFGSW